MALLITHRRPLRILDLFSGIGGFSLAFHGAGCQTVGFVECDDNCRQLLSVKWPGVPRFDDVQTVGKRNLPKCDIICGGFPCQDLSVAGNRAGLSGRRSGLFYEMARITNEIKPAFLVWENVPGLLSSDKGRDFARVLLALDKIGYRGAWRTLDAQYFGVAQRRRRVFGVFARNNIGAGVCSTILSLAEGVCGNSATMPQTAQEVAGTVKGGTGARGWPDSSDGNSRGLTLAPKVAQPLRTNIYNNSDPMMEARGMIVTGVVNMQGSKGMGVTQAGDKPSYSLNALHGHDVHAISFQPGNLCRKAGANPNPNPNLFSTLGATTQGDQAPHVAGCGVARRLTPTECERLQGFPDGWTAGFADGVRYRMLGNAVAVPVVAWIARRLVCNWPQLPKC